MAATSTQFELIDQLIGKMEEQAASDPPAFKLFKLDHAQAASVLQMVRQVVDANVRSKQAGGQSAPITRSAPRTPPTASR